MGLAARSAMKRMHYQVQIPIVQRQKAQLGKQQGTDQVVNWIQRGLNRLDEKLEENAQIIFNLKCRAATMQKCQGDVEAQGDEMAKAGADFLYWLENYAFTYDPRRKQKTIPFIPFEYQKNAVAWMQKLREDSTEGIIEKARDMGATWLIVAFFTHAWLFEEQFTGLFCSRKVTLVDSKGDPSSIMEKARIIIRGLPSWMMPKGYDEARHALKLRIVNPANGSVLTGEGGNQIGRGGRATMVLVDEAAFGKQPENIEASLSETSDIKIWLSTPNAPGDWFAQKRHAEGARVLSMRWREDPRKNEWVALDESGTVVARGRGDAPDPQKVGARRVLWPWYEKAKARFTDPAKLAREVDIDYSASSDAVVFPAAWILAAVNLDLGDEWDTVECGADLSGQGVDKDIWTYRRGPCVKMQKEIDRPNSTLKARMFLNITNSVGAQVLHYDTGGGYGNALHGEYESGGGTWKFELNGIVSQAGATRRLFGDKAARELFRDLKAELYWAVRERFRKSYELHLWRQGDLAGIPHNPAECISIPNDPELVAQLGSILYIEQSSGLVAMESKDKMKERGVKSPDKADSLVYSFAPRKKRAQIARTVTL
jgi:phage terminase large subunit